MENLLEKLLEMEKEQQVDSAASGDQPRRGDGDGGARAHEANTSPPRREGAGGKGRLLQQQTLSHRHSHANRQVIDSQLSAVVLEFTYFFIY